MAVSEYYCCPHEPSQPRRADKRAQSRRSCRPLPHLGTKIPPGTRDFQMMKTSPCQAQEASPVSAGPPSDSDTWKHRAPTAAAPSPNTVRIGTGACFMCGWRGPPEEKNEKCKEVVHAHRTEVIASCSELLSLHCPRQLLLLALLPACAGSQLIMRQERSAYAEDTLRTVGLLVAAHQYSLQDMHRSTCTPTLLYPLHRGDSLTT